MTFTHKYWKEHSIANIHCRGYHSLLHHEHFKSHGFQRIKYRGGMVASSYFHRRAVTRWPYPTRVSRRSKRKLWFRYRAIDRQVRHHLWQHEQIMKEVDDVLQPDNMDDQL